MRYTIVKGPSPDRMRVIECDELPPDLYDEPYCSVTLNEPVSGKAVLRLIGNGTSGTVIE
jgi:hypothetical protein